MNDIVKFNDEKGQLVQFTAQDVKERICPNIDDKELALVMGLCQAQNLNPFTRDVYVIKYGNAPASIVTGKEVFTKRANQQKAYQGFEAGVTYINARGEVCQREGSAVYKAAKETLIGGWCRVYVDGRRPFYDEVTLDEYQLTDQQGKPKSNWAKMPATMIRKVALVHCLREAFPDSFQGLYAAEEMGKVGEQVEQLEQAQETKPASNVVAEAEFVELASEEQLEYLDNLVATFAAACAKSPEEVKAALFVTKTMTDAGATSNEELTPAQANAAIQVLKSWIAKKAEQEAQQEQAAAPRVYASELDRALQETTALFEGEGFADKDIPF